MSTTYLPLPTYHILIAISVQVSATGAPGPLYAELELKKAKQKVSLPDMTDVQYSEIKTDEVKKKQHQQHKQLLYYKITVFLSACSQ